MTLRLYPYSCCNVECPLCQFVALRVMRGCLFLLSYTEWPLWQILNLWQKNWESIPAAHQPLLHLHKVQKKSLFNSLQIYPQSNTNMHNTVIQRVSVKCNNVWQFHFICSSKWPLWRTVAHIRLETSLVLREIQVSSSRSNSTVTKSLTAAMFVRSNVKQTKGDINTMWTIKSVNLLGVYSRDWQWCQ